MGDKDQGSGEREIYRKGVDQEVDAEGHAIRRSGTDEPARGERDIRGRAADQDAEGHLIKHGRGVGGSDQPPKDEAEGHGIRWGAADRSADEPPDDDAEGHRFKF
jgi:hypothetical protein